MRVRLTVGELTRRRRLLAPAAVVLAVSVALAGCTTFEKTRAAAFVEGRPIPSDEVAQVTRQFNDNLAASGTNRVQESQVLGVLILAPFVLDQVRSSGSWTPDARYNAALAKIPTATQATKDFIATSIVLAQGGPLTQQDATAILDKLKKAKVELNPRFGTWDPNTGGFLAPSENWIKPAPTPTATGSPTPTPSASPTAPESPSGAPSDVPTTP